MLSQKPYFIRAIYEWCNDNNLTPYIATQIDDNTIVPNQYVQNGQIMLNIAKLATKDLIIDNKWITFQATFGGVINDIAIPTQNIIAIFAKENGEGMQFEITPIDDESQETVESKQHGLKLIK